MKKNLKSIFRLPYNGDAVIHSNTAVITISQIYDSFTGHRVEITVNPKKDSRVMSKKDSKKIVVARTRNI